MAESWMNSFWFSWVVLPFLIFIARIADVTIGTIRLIFVARGMKVLAPLAGFFEVLIWLVVISQIMQHLANPLCYIAYAAGFAAGNYIGMMLVDRLSLGKVIIRIITQKDAGPLVESLKEHQFGVTVLDGRGVQGKVQVIFTVVKRAHIEDVQRLIRQFNPQAFYSIEEVGDVEKGVFPAEKTRWKAEWLRALMPFRKGK
ncbi:MAG TPA: DUF2179 domain-containing protein [Anaerohalosphaeraceae bacterium]|nr:DUF2179 domain-containing protein [Anaerohalosphaeraceae bacterium]HOL89347.1 DUF2179 domain-containing protein [Anaerohalosphaeraceae bacterium]HPP56786.1 DUF2179 domain-containing protein [Anaerohalosphaeraceae bacterium]